MSKKQLYRRLDKLAARATTKKLGILPIIDVLAWPDEDRFAYARASGRGDEATCNALVEEHYGKLPEPIGDEIVAIIVADHPMALVPGHDHDDEDD